MTQRPLLAGRSLALLGILLVAINLRTPVAALSPILDRIDRDVPLDPVVLGLIGALPPLVFAVTGLLAPLVARRLGLERALLAALAAMALGHLGRALAPEAIALTAATTLVLVGAGIGNVILPPVVRRYFPDRVGLVTALYATLISVSAGVPPLLAVPVADAAGWRVSLGIWVLTATVAAVPWLPHLVRRREPAGEREAPIRTGPTPPALGTRLLRSPTAWGIGVLFGVQSLSVYAAFAWMPPMLVDRADVTDAAAGALVALFALTGFPMALLIPVLAVRFPRGIPAMVLVSAGLFAIGYLGLLLAPASAPVVWVLSVGFATLLFPLALVLINQRASSPASAASLSGFVHAVGYLIAGTGTFAVGLLRDASGGWTVPLVFLLLTVVSILPFAAVLARNRRVDADR